MKNIQTDRSLRVCRATLSCSTQRSTNSRRVTFEAASLNEITQAVRLQQRQFLLPVLRQGFELYSPRSSRSVFSHATPHR
ncbi:MAG: hypothetical protein MZU97_11060 [Bacillus subtilis]|nr:hypothetical protein [Bacillus subtilis]